MLVRVVVLMSIMATGIAAMKLAQEPPLVPAPGSPISVAPGPNNLGTADVNNDGKIDVVVTSSASRRITVLLGQGNGTFVTADGNPFAVAIAPNEMALGDINGDGHVDLAVASHDSYDVVLLLGDGRGEFRPANTSPIVMKRGSQPHTHGLAIVDVNGDRKADLAIASSNDDDDLAVALGDGHGGFMPAATSPFAVAPSPYPFAQGDLDADGALDFVSTSTGLGPKPENRSSPARALTALFGDGRGGFRRVDIPMRTAQTWFVAIGDVNGDQRSDLVTTHTEDQRLTVLLGNGRGAFSEVAGSPFGIGQTAWYISLADFNRDGLIDVLAAAGTEVRILLGDGRGAFRQSHVFPTGKGSWRLVAADLNGDGRMDVVTSNLESNNVSVLLAP